MGKSKRKKEPKWYDSIEVVLAIVGFILLIGLIIYHFTEKKKEETQLTKEQQQKLFLEQIQARIKELEPQMVQLMKREKLYFFWARFIIGFLLVSINGVYLYFDNWKDFSLGDQLNVNAGIALIYSFVAFILYGSPSALVRAIKTRASQIFQRKHLHVLSELQLLKEQEKEIKLYLSQHEQNKLTEKNERIEII